MKKSFVIIVSLAAIMMFSSFVIVHNATNHNSENIETVFGNDGWEYYKPVEVYYNNGKSHMTSYVWKKTVCGDPDYLLSSSSSSLSSEKSINKNYRFEKDQDWTTEYKYTVSSVPGFSTGTGYFNAYLQGWD